MTSPLHVRSRWGGRNPRSTSRNIAPEGITVHYGGPSPWGTGVDRSSDSEFTRTADHDRCAGILRAWQAYHIDHNGWADLAYSSAVCPHGHRYDARGPGVRTAAQGTNDGNRRSHAVVYIAGDQDPLTSPAKQAFRDETARLGPLRWNHGDWKPTACAGPNLRRWQTRGWPLPSEHPDAVTAPSPTWPADRPRLLHRGIQGGDVRGWQKILVGAGDNIAVDGIFGPATEAATRAFQSRLGVAPDGIVGRETRAATDRLLRWLVAGADDATSTRGPERQAFPGTVRSGDSGPTVRTWQRALVDRGYQIAVDGIFGPATNHVVRDWQRKHGLGVDGIAGPATWHSILDA